LKKVRFKVHDCRTPHEYVGTTRRGLRVEVNEDFAAADVKVSAELRTPGVSSLDTIVEHHMRWYRYGRNAGGIPLGRR